jgi:hypothetical protein
LGLESSRPKRNEGEVYSPSDILSNALWGPLRNAPR